MRKIRVLRVLGWLVFSLLLASPQQSWAGDDDFGRIVRHIETQYGVHRQHRFVMGLAGFAVKFYHVGGVKGFKGAIFENQRFLNTASDSRFDEVVRAAMNSGWQPMVQSWDRHSGEKTYIYAQEVLSKKGKDKGKDKDMKVLLVSLEPDEAVVLEVKMNPEKLSEFVHEASAGRHHRDVPVLDADKPVVEEPIVEAAAPVSPGWSVDCLFVPEEAEYPND